jgi:Fe-S oxidoreductase
MYSLQFDVKTCLACPTQDCLTKCQHMTIDRETAKREILKIAEGVDSFILHDCVTCYACEEYCSFGNHPFYLIAEKQEELDVAPVPRPLVKRTVNLGVPFRGEPEITEVNGPVLNMAAFSSLTHLIKGKLFEGLTIISGDERKQFHYFCQLMYLHYGKSSIIKERLPGIIRKIARHKPTEVICFHDECYGAYTSYCQAVGIDVPFRQVHFYEYLYERLLQLRDVIKPLNVKVAYQRPCSSRLSPDKHRFVNDIFTVIGARPVARQYTDKNALCCAGAIQGQRREGSRKRALKLQRDNVADMKAAGAEICIFNCPACFQTLGGLADDAGIKPMFMSDLCRVALGETPEVWR